VNKSGQFYLVTAIILATVIIGLTAILNSSLTESNIKIYDLEDEIQIESRNVFDYGLNQELSEQAFGSRLLDFTKDYTDYQRDKNVYFIFGTKNNITVSGYQKEDKSVSLNSLLITDEAGEFAGSMNLGTSTEIILYIDSLQYNFPLNVGRNFYFVVSKKTGVEEYIISG